VGGTDRRRYRLVAVVGLICATAGAVAGAFIADRGWSRWDLGSAAEWGAVIVGGAAAIGAFILLRQGQRALEDERKHRAEDAGRFEQQLEQGRQALEADRWWRESEQVRSVRVALARSHVVDEPLADAARRGTATPGTPMQPGVYATVEYWNRATLPLPRLMVALTRVRIGDPEIQVISAEYMREVPPTDEPLRTELRIHGLGRPYEDDSPPAGLEVVAWMVDHNGTEWWRDRQSRLVRERPQPGLLERMINVYFQQPSR